MRIENESEVREVAHAIEETFRTQQRLPQPTNEFWETIARAALVRAEMIFLRRKEAEARAVLRRAANLGDGVTVGSGGRRTDEELT